MAHIQLKRLLSKRRETIGIVTALLTALDAPISVHDIDGEHLAGTANVSKDGMYSVTCGGKTIGWTNGHERAELIARLLTHLANKETKKSTLADEMLERYSELNLLYNLSEKL